MTLPIEGNMDGGAPNDLLLDNVYIRVLRASTQEAQRQFHALLQPTAIGLTLYMTRTTIQGDGGHARALDVRDGSLVYAEGALLWLNACVAYLWMPCQTCVNTCQVWNSFYDATHVPSGTGMGQAILSVAALYLSTPDPKHQSYAAYVCRLHLPGLIHSRWTRHHDQRGSCVAEFLPL